jgi:hypothetical protein
MSRPAGNSVGATYRGETWAARQIPANYGQIVLAGRRHTR